MPESFFIEVAGLRPVTLLKKRLWQDALLWILRNFKKNFLIEHLRVIASKVEISLSLWLLLPMIRYTFNYIFKRVYKSLYLEDKNFILYSRDMIKFYLSICGNSYDDIVDFAVEVIVRNVVCQEPKFIFKDTVMQIKCSHSVSLF